MLTMSRTLLAGAGAAGAISVVLALGPAAVQTPATTLTGCLRAGSAQGVYLLRGASQDAAAAVPDGAGSMPEDYLLVSVPSQIDLAPHLNHRVSITGVVSSAKQGPAPPAGANAAERALKRIAVQSVREVAQNCAGNPAPVLPPG